MECVWNVAALPQALKGGTELASVGGVQRGIEAPSELQSGDAELSEKCIHTSNDYMWPNLNLPSESTLKAND